MGAGRPTDDAIVDALARHAGNVSRAAEELGIVRATLRSRAVAIPKAAAVLGARPHVTKPRRRTDAEIAEAVAKHGTYSAAAAALCESPRASRHARSPAPVVGASPGRGRAFGGITPNTSRSTRHRAGVQSYTRPVGVSRTDHDAPSPATSRASS